MKENQSDDDQDFLYQPLQIQVKQQEQKTGSLLCSCSIKKPTIHYRKTSVPEQTKDYPLNCIGKIIVFTLKQNSQLIQVKETQSTGFLIGHGIAMTAASCISSPLDIQQGQPQSMIFFEILDDNGQIKWFKVLLWAIHKDFQKKLDTCNYHEHDIALLFFDDKKPQLKRKIKLNFTEQRQQCLKLAFCPSIFSQLYKKHQGKPQEHVQLIGKNEFIGHKYSCSGHWEEEPIIQGFAGSPLLKYFTNQQGQKDCEVVGLIRKYETIYWWLGVKVIFSRNDNNLINLCKMITERKRQSTFEDFAKEIAKFKEGLYVIQCIEVWPKGVDKNILQRMEKYFYQKSE